MEKCVELAKTHRDLWRYHDERKWQKLRQVAFKHLVLLGYPKQKAEKSSKHVAMTFLLADKALNAQLIKTPELEDEFYVEAENEFRKAHEILGAETASIPYKIKWIKASRYGNKLSVFLNLSLEHIVRLGLKQSTLQALYYAFFQVYPAHAAHDWTRLEAAFRNYWHSLESSYQKGIFPPQF